MEHKQEKSTSLPENAYRELKEGEEYKPVMPAGSKYPEVTRWSLGMGLLMAVIFSAAAAYSGLKIGQVFEAAIPIAIIAKMGFDVHIPPRYATVYQNGKRPHRRLQEAYPLT